MAAFLKLLAVACLPAARAQDELDPLHSPEVKQVLREAHETLVAISNMCVSSHPNVFQKMSNHVAKLRTGLLCESVFSAMHSGIDLLGTVLGVRDRSENIIHSSGVFATVWAVRQMGSHMETLLTDMNFADGDGDIKKALEPRMTQVVDMLNDGIENYLRQLARQQNGGGGIHPEVLNQIWNSFKHLEDFCRILVEVEEKIP